MTKSTIWKSWISLKMGSSWNCLKITKLYTHNTKTFCENKTDPVTVSSFSKMGWSWNCKKKHKPHMSKEIQTRYKTWHMHTLFPSRSLAELSSREEEEMFGEWRFWSEQSSATDDSLVKVCFLSGNGIVFPNSFIAGSFNSNILFLCL